MDAREGIPLRFAKLSANGNDFVLVEGTEVFGFSLPDLARKILRRRFSVGGDGLIVLEMKSESSLELKFFNPDGSEAEICGNSMICAGKYLRELKGLRGELTVHFRAGVRKIRIKEAAVEAQVARISHKYEEIEFPEIEADLKGFFTGEIGNPHVVIIGEIPDNKRFRRIAPLIENHKRFPSRTNVEFLKILDSQRGLLRIWERGAGETLSCATGASAAFLIGLNLDLLSPPAILQSKGGTHRLWIEGDEIWLSAEALLPYVGEYLGID